MMKPGSRILALDDSAFLKKGGKSLVVGVIGREKLVEGVISFSVSSDGKDATAQIIEVVRKSRFRPQIKLIVLNGTVLAGLNIVDAERIRRILSIPVAGITRRKPHPDKLAEAIEKSNKYVSYRMQVLDSIKDNMTLYRHRGYYLQLFGMSKKDVDARFEEMIAFLRLAHLIGSGIAKGESRGRI